MIVRTYWYVCENCGGRGFLKWGASFPETAKCPTCENKTLRVTGHRDFSSTQLAIQKELNHVR